jgi:hypothetical protein
MEYRTMNKNKIGFKGWIQNGRVADSNGGLICSPHTNVSEEENFGA